jgi:CBS domain containing-hemolysin-like protein
MVDLLTVARLLGGVGLLLGNGFFVTTEFAMTRVRQFPESEFQGARLERAWEMTERLELFLSGCQVGITICSVGLGVVAEPAVAAVLDPLVRALGVGSPGAAGHTAASVVLALAIINLLHVVVGEQAPTYLGVERAKHVAGLGATPLFYWTKLMWPVIVLADRSAKLLLRPLGVEMTRSWTEEELDGDEEPAEGEALPASRGELRREMGDALRNLGVPAERRQEVINALEIGDRPVREVMMPRDRIVALSTEDDLEENLRRVREYPHARFPLVGDELEAFVGVVYTPALLRDLEEIRAGGTTLAKLAAPPMSVSPDEEVADLIDRFQAEHGELALVVDDGEVVGLVTATDAFEAITGDLDDPLDLEMPHLDT